MAKKSAKSAKSVVKNTVVEKPRSGVEGGLNSQKAAAKYAKVNTRTIRRWVANGMPTGKLKGKTIYIAEMLDFYKESEGNQGSPDRKREQKAQADYKTTKATLLELELKIKQGELIEREQIERENIRKILTVKRGIFGMVRKVVAAVPARYRRKVQTLAEAEAKNLIEGFSKK